MKTLITHLRETSQILRSRYGLLWMIAIAVLSLTSCNKETMQSTYTIDHTFHLKDTEGNDISNVIVELYYQSSQHGLLLFSKERTNNEGKIKYEKLDAGDYQTRVYIPHLAYQSLDFHVDEKQTNSVFVADTHVEMPTQLYMTGTATGSTDPHQAVPLAQDPDDPFIFTYNSVLDAGEFYFLSEAGKPEKAFYKGNSLLVDDLVFSPDGESSKGFSIPRQGIYKLRVDFNTFVLTLQEEGKDFTELYAKGSAVPSGISRLMTPNRDKSGVFHFYEVLQVGEFHISTKASDDANSPHFTSADGNGNIQSEDVNLVGSQTSGNTWKITQAGAYKITFDLMDMKIKIIPYTPLTNIWIVGTASEAGSTNNPSDTHKFKPVSGDPYSYYYEGNIKAGASDDFKLALARGNWDQPNYMPVGSNGTNPLVDNRIMYMQSPYPANGGSDKKWKLKPEEAGRYRITINQLKETIMMEKL